MSEIEKSCCTCHQPKPLREFNRLTRSKDGRQPSCRECNRQYHQDNRDRHMAQIRARKQREIAVARRNLIAHLRAHPCIDCGESDIEVLEFDHQRDKTRNVGYLVHGGYGWHRVKEEIDKCEVVCANCHRRRTLRQQNSYRLRPDDGEWLDV